MKNKNNINLELLAEVLHVYSVSNATHIGRDLHITFRDEKDDNSSWLDANIHELGYLYKDWAKKKGYSIASVHNDGKYQAWDIDDVNLTAEDNNGEPKAIRLVCEEIYDILNENENEKTSF